MQFPIQFHKRKSEIAPFLHFSTLRHWVISDFRLLHYRDTPALRRWNSPLVPRRLYLYIYTRVHRLLFYGIIIFKFWSFFYLFIYLFIYLLLFNYLFVYLFVSLFVFFFFFLVSRRATRLVTCVHRLLFLLALCIL